MLRWVAIAGVAWMASACTVGLPSAVDAAPFEARMTASPIAEATYCGLKLGDDGAFLVRGDTADDENNCAVFGWDEHERLVGAVDPDGNEPAITFAPVDLGNGLFLIQVALTEDQRDGDPFAFTLMAGVANHGAIAFVPLPTNGKIGDEVISHPGVTFSRHASRAPVAYDDATGETIRAPDIVYISAGSPADIHDLARDLFERMVRDLAAKAVSQGYPTGAGIPMFVRSEDRTEDRKPSAAQQRDIDALREKVLALAQ